MATFRPPFAYNNGGPIDGTTQYNDLVVGNINVDYSSDYGGVKWWASPEESSGYIIGNARPGGQPIPSGVTGTANVGFWRSKGRTDQAFLDLANYIGAKNGQPTFTTTYQAEIWLESNGYYTSFNLPTPTPTVTQTQTPQVTSTPTNTQTPSVTPTNTQTPTPSITASQTVTPTNTTTQTQTPTPSITASQTVTPTPSITASQTVTPTVTQTRTPTQTPTPTTIVKTGLILNYDISNSLSYPGSGTTVTDLQGNSNATLSGGPTYSSNNGGYLTFVGSSSQSLLLNTSLNSVLSPANTSTVISYFTWVYLTGNGVIVDERGNTGWQDSQIEMVSGTIRFSVWNNGTGFASTVATPLNAWYYVGLTYDGTTLRAYVNGSAAGTATYSRQTPYNSGGDSLKYGIALADTTNLGNGGYGNFRFGAFQVYNTALNSSNVLQNYNTQKSRFGL